MLMRECHSCLFRLVSSGVISEEHGTVVIAGLGNGYADYTVTFEEYQQQRYEAASTRVPSPSALT